MFFGEASTLASVSTSEGRSTVSFALSGKPFVEGWHNRNQHFVVSVGSGIGLFRNERETLHAPFIAELNKFYGRECHYSWNEAYAELGSLGIICPLLTNDLTLRGTQRG